MTDISLDLSSKLPAEQVDTIRRVVRTAEGLGLSRLFIVGAQARDLVLQYAHNLPVRRLTNDIDFGIVAETWVEFARLREALIVDEHFRPHPNQMQRLLFKESVIIDLVPFGDLEQTAGLIAWPPDFAVVMSTVGFREAFANSIGVRLAGDLVVKVASLAGLGLLKIVAWSDRHFERDAQDLGLIMKHYLDAGNQDRVYGDQGDCSDLLNEYFDYDRASARVLGRDIERLSTVESRHVIEDVLAEATAKEGDGALALAMAKSGANYNGDVDLALTMLEELRKGSCDSF
jgi:predicted nucleotidyltransferase